MSIDCIDIMIKHQLITPEVKRDKLIDGKRERETRNLKFMLIELVAARF